MVGVKWV